jgi:hypothetical protein
MQQQWRESGWGVAESAMLFRRNREIVTLIKEAADGDSEREEVD